jgi:cytochrome c
MSSTLKAPVLFALVSLPALVLAQSASYGTAPEAKAMVQHVIAELKTDPSGAIAKFNKPDGPFRDRDLYVFCFDAKSGIFSAQINPALLGTDNRQLKEKDGTPLGQRVYDAVQPLKDGEIITMTYHYPRPGTTTPLLKEVYVTRVGNTACGVGYYKQ